MERASKKTKKKRESFKEFTKGLAAADMGNALVKLWGDGDRVQWETFEAMVNNAIYGEALPTKRQKRRAKRR